ncbi:hypothetical protein [Krasilnikovia sp. MM14-A1004]|uniref:hypothetical protein n=1 Tax=Krasilnikovia sp. MM14-A1004 TaxID=3373541 RepID=UPI00399CA669
MTPTDPRIAAAVQAASQLRELVLREAPRGFRFAWADRLRQMLDILATDDDPAEVLTYAALTLDRMYAGGRNFADFSIYRADRAEMLAENEKLTALITELRRLLHGN